MEDKENEKDWLVLIVKKEDITKKNRKIDINEFISIALIKSNQIELIFSIFQIFPFVLSFSFPSIILWIMTFHFFKKKSDVAGYGVRDRTPWNKIILYGGTNMDEEEKKPSVIKKLFKAIAIAIIAGVYLVLMIRMFVSCDSPLTKKILKNDAIIAAYEADPQGFEIQKYSFSDYYRNVDEGKLLMLDNLYYLVPTRDLQISVKYNTKIIDTPAADGSIPFAFYLEDEKGNRYSDYFYEYEERYGFGYIRLDFRGIDLIDPDGGVDENGEPVRKNYEMYLMKKNADGSTNDYESFSIYLGDPNYRKIFYK